MLEVCLSHNLDLLVDGSVEVKHTWRGGRIQRWRTTRGFKEKNDLLTIPDFQFFPWYIQLNILRRPSVLTYVSKRYAVNQRCMTYLDDSLCMDKLFLPRQNKSKCKLFLATLSFGIILSH